MSAMAPMAASERGTASGAGRHSNDAYDRIAAYWNEHIHDLSVATQPAGSRGFFEELDAYRFDKLRYLPKLVDFGAFGGQSLLEVGCGVGIDLARFAGGGARVTGIDLAATSIELARTNLSQRGLTGELSVMNGEQMSFADSQFDMVYAHGALQYTADAARMAAEIHRVLKPGGTAIMMVYNRRSWLRFMSKTMGVGLEHEDSPFLRLFTRREFRSVLAPFRNVRIVPERFPVATKLHRGVKAVLYNGVFVGVFNLLPRPLVRWSGWHLMAFATK
ncbi:MAG: class I SAM-dependent methyltransferase [Phycisphaerales bacterium]|nr:class I SAM-dependent methyltransferase [Phycisphaerales bacterium]